MEVATHQHLLREGHYVWGRRQAEVLVAPELAGRTSPRLYLIDEQGSSVLMECQRGCQWIICTTAIPRNTDSFVQAAL